MSSSSASDSIETLIGMDLCLINKHKEDLNNALKQCRNGRKLNIDQAVALFRTGTYSHSDIVNMFDISCLGSINPPNLDEVPFN